MATDPLIPDSTNDSQPGKAGGYVLPQRQDPVQPSGNADEDAGRAADLIREKLARIYAEEPSAEQEAAEVEAEARPLSKHQQFLHELTASGKDLATVQTEWHQYYIGLPDTEKHQVWQEFYDSNVNLPAKPAIKKPTNQSLAELKQQTVTSERRKAPAAAARRKQKLRDARSAKEVQAAIRDTVSAGGKLQVKHHVQSLLFGLGTGAIVVIIFLFSFFNEFFIAPFIQPSRVAAATPIIVNSTTVAASATPEVIIPKINVEIPIDYSETSTNESVIENDLENGVVHYPTTVLPGQQGNAAFFGHSSNNIFNQGKYKFAFVLLHTLVPGDTFYLTYNKTVYVYKVISKNVVSPNDVSVLSSIPGQTATATLITCDPPGTSLNRLVVVGQQISPDPSGNTAAAPPVSTQATGTTLPGNGPTLWTRVMSTAAGKVIGVLVILVLFVLTLRWVNKPKREATGAGRTTY